MPTPVTGSQEVVLAGHDFSGLRIHGQFDIVALGGLESALYDWTGFVGYGVQGAAIATIFSRALAFVVGRASVVL